MNVVWIIAALMFSSSPMREPATCTKCEIATGEGRLVIGGSPLGLKLSKENISVLGKGVSSTLWGDLKPNTKLFLNGKEVTLGELRSKSGEMKGTGVVCWPDVYEGELARWFLLVNLEAGEH